MPSQNLKLPLDGIRVLAFTHAVMGPSAGLILGDLGADVIHVEALKGDPTRRLKGFGIGYYPYLNRNNRSVAIDIKNDDGRAVVHRLVERADVLVENFGPGTMDRLGYGYAAMAELNPRLIYCALKGFMPGPYEMRTAMDEVVQMMGGLAYMTGPPGHPLRAGSSIIDLTGGMFGAMGIITALYERRTTGKGTFIKSTLFESTAFIMGQHMAYAALVDDPVPPMPARVSAWSVYRLFETSDKSQVFVGIISDKQWLNFCEVFRRADLRDDPRLETNNQRIDERDWLLPDLQKMMGGLTKTEILTRCAKAGIPFAPIARPEDLFDDPQLNQDQGLLETTFPSGVKTKMPRLPFRIGTHDFGIRRDPPARVGQHTRAILAETGLAPDQIEALLSNGAVAAAHSAGNKGATDG